MTLPRKGSRAITVGGHDYRWIVSPDSGYMVLVVERAAGTGQRLEVTLPYGDDPQRGQTIHIDPGVVRQAIERALAQGWTPERLGAPPFPMRQDPA